MKHLQCLWLDHTEVSDTGVSKLQQTLPHCQIIH